MSDSGDQKVEGWTRDEWLQYYVEEGLSEVEARVIVAIGFGDISGDLLWSDELESDDLDEEE